MPSFITKVPSGGFNSSSRIMLGSSAIEGGHITTCFTSKEHEALYKRLWKAIQDDDSAAIKQAAKDGADVDERVSPNGWDHLMTAICSNKQNAVIALLEAGAGLNASDQRGYTHLHIAAEKGHDKVAKALLAAGANPSALDNHKTRRSIAMPCDTCISAAKKNGHKELASYLQSIADDEALRPTPEEVGLDMKQRDAALKMLDERRKAEVRGKPRVRGR